MTLHLVVPATLSNLGSGFDVLGLALSLSNQFTFAVDGPAGSLTERGERLDPETHGVAGALRAAERAFGAVVPVGLSLRQVERVPRSRGLGSSATARVAGYLAWCHYAGRRPPLAEGLGFLAELEGHPDNATAAMLGGVTVAAGGDPFVWRTIAPLHGLRVAVCVPELRVSTDAARAALPDACSRDDLVYNARRLALLMTGLWTGDSEALRLGVADRVHTPWRKALIGPVDEVIAAAERAGAACAFISGSGSALAAFVVDPAVDAAAVGRAMEGPLRAAGLACRADVLHPAPVGAWQMFTEGTVPGHP